MNRKFETLEELEAWCIEKGAAGITEILISGIKAVKAENEKLNETIDTLTLQMLEGGLV